MQRRVGESLRGRTATADAAYAVHIPTETGEYGPVEDAFSLLDHMVTAHLARRRQASGDAVPAATR